MVFGSLPLGANASDGAALPGMDWLQVCAAIAGLWLYTVAELVGTFFSAYWLHTLVALFHVVQLQRVARVRPTSPCTTCGGALLARRAPLARTYTVDVVAALATTVLYAWDSSFLDAYGALVVTHLVLLAARLLAAHGLLARNTLECAASTALTRLDAVYARLEPEVRAHAAGYVAAPARATALDDVPASRQRPTLLAFFTTNVLALARVLPESNVAALKETLKAHASTGRCPRAGHVQASACAART